MRRFQDLRSRLISTAFKRINRLAPSKNRRSTGAACAPGSGFICPYTAMNRYKPGTAKFDAFEAGFILPATTCKAPTK